MSTMQGVLFYRRIILPIFAALFSPEIARPRCDPASISSSRSPERVATGSDTPDRLGHIRIRLISAALNANQSSVLGRCAEIADVIKARSPRGGALNHNRCKFFPNLASSPHFQATSFSTSRLYSLSFSLTGGTSARCDKSLYGLATK